MTRTEVEDEIVAQCGRYYDDPLGFVLWAFPWGEVGGPLEHESGPDTNQREFLNSLAGEVRSRNFDGHTPVMPILMAESSGHGTGKSAMGAWLTWWILSTRPNSQGTITAGTFQQLEERTWAAIQSWGRMCITSHWFEIMAQGIYSRLNPSGWKAMIQTAIEEKSQAFAGQHARTSTSWYLFDEASQIPSGVWKVSMGGLTDGEPMIFAWGQLDRNTGYFYRVCCGDLNAYWNHRRVDSRTSRFTNKDWCQKVIDQNGINSDEARVRILGLPPMASELQYIDRQRVDEARKREVYCLEDEPLIAGMDVSGGGSAWTVIRFRRGNDARSLPPIRITGQDTRDRSKVIAICAEVLADRRPGRKVAALFVDMAFGSPIVERLHTMGFHHAMEVNFGGPAPSHDCANWRAFMHMKMKDWLLMGAIPDDDELANQLCLPGYHRNASNKLVIESKADIQKRGEKSPDDGDALALTFAQPVAREEKPGEYDRYRSSPTRRLGADSWMG